jgi:hypothetical protein
MLTMTVALRSLPGQPSHHLDRRAHRPAAALADPPRRARRPRRAPTEVRRASPRASERCSSATYRRRRAAVGLLLAGIVGSAALVAGNVLTGPGGVPASAAGAGTAPLERTVRARPGDSLWSIAEVFHGDVAISRYVDALIARNGGTRIEAGQVVRLP